VRAFGADCVNFNPVPHQQDLLVADMAEQFAAVSKLSKGDALREIGISSLRLILNQSLHPLREKSDRFDLKKYRTV
jgi:hypothetical protein